MDMQDFLLKLSERGIRILLDKNGALRVKGKKEQLDAQLVETLKSNRSDIADYLKHLDVVQAPPPKEPAPVAAKVSQSEQKHLVEGLNQTGLEFYRSDAFGELTLHSLVEAQVVDHPNKIAVEFKDGRLTYAQLNRGANQLATFLRRQGIDADALVGICLEPSTTLILTMLAVLKSGGAYVVVTPDNITPVADCQFDLVLTNTSYKPRFSDVQYTVHCLDELEVKQAVEVCSSANPQVLETQNAFALACVTFGSCPQGIERGVMIEHGNIIALVRDPDFVKLDSHHVVGFCADLVSDIATFEIWGALANGATLIEINRNLQSSPAMLKQALALKNVNILHLPMPLVSHLLARRADCFAGLDYLLLSGSNAQVDDINKLVDGGKPKHLVYLYGVIENTTFSTSVEISRRVESLPLGKPISASYCHILDEELQLVPQGEEGTLYVGGFGLARGYVGNWQETELKFLTNPFSDDPNDRIFSTAIKARYLSDGTIQATEQLPQQAQQTPVLTTSAFEQDKAVQSKGKFYQQVWQSQPLSTLQKSPLLPGGCFVIFCDNYGLGDSLAGRLRLSSQHVICVRVGQDFEQIAEQEFLVAPGHSASYAQLMDKLAEQGIEQLQLLHLWSIAALDTLAPCEAVFEQLARFEGHLAKGLGSVELFSSAAEAKGINLAQVNMVTRQCCSVTSDERLLPSAATIAALRENSREVRQIDLGLEQMPPDADKVAQFSDFIALELTVDKRLPLVAYRGKQRWKVNQSSCSIHQEAALNITQAGNFLLLGDNAQRRHQLYQQLCTYSVAARVVQLGPEGADCDSDGEFIAVDLNEPEQVADAIKQVREDIGQLNGIIYCPSGHSSAAKTIHTLLLLDRETQQNPTEFCLVLWDEQDDQQAKVAQAYTQGFVQNKHNLGCERWMHVMLESNDNEADFSIAQLMQLDRIANLIWRP